MAVWAIWAVNVISNSCLVDISIGVYQCMVGSGVEEVARHLVLLEDIVRRNFTCVCGVYVYRSSSGRNNGHLEVEQIQPVHQHP